MANLIDVANELEYVPKDQLASFVNDPNSRYPSYMVLSEIQRRTQLEKAYNAQQTEMQPNTTVADEVVANFTGQGLASAMPPTEMNPQEASMQGMQGMQGMEGMQGMQMMAEGGITGYREGGQSYYDRALEGIKGRYMDEDGSFDKSQIALDAGLAALTFTPVGVAGRGLQLAGAAAKYLKPSMIGKGLKGLYNTAARKLGAREARKLNPRALPSGAQTSGVPTRPGYYEGLGGQVIRRNIPRVLGAGYLGSQLMGDDEALPQEIPDDKPDRQPSDDTGLSAISGKSEASFDPLDMARMGFALMGARDTSELASGLSGITEDIQSRRREQPLIDAQLNEIKAKVNYYNSQGEYNKADQISQLANNLAQQIEAMMLTNDMEGASQAAIRLGQINNELSIELGIETPSESDIVNRNLAK